MLDLYFKLNLSIMNNLMKFLSILIISCMLVSCHKNDDNTITNKYVSGEGKIISKTLELNSFYEIIFMSIGDVNITIGEKQSVTVKAQQNIMDVLTWEVKSNKLYLGIEENTSIQDADDITFNIVIPDLYRIKLTGVGSIEIDGDDLASLDIEFEGVGNINAYSIAIDECSIVSAGVGNCKVKVNNNLDVTLTGVGNVYYKGNPKVTSSVSGIGNLVNDN